MARIEDYALIGNCETVALVSRHASVDWLCLPRFDSDACFAALLGDQQHGHWRIAPKDAQACQSRRYRDGTLVLETEFKTDDGRVQIVDCMRARDDGGSEVLRLVRGLEGTVQMRMDLRMRLGYGKVVPWVTTTDDGRLRAVAGPDCLVLDTPVELHGGEELDTQAEFNVSAGEEIPFALSWGLSWQALPDAPDVSAAIDEVTTWWAHWSSRCKDCDSWTPAVKRSLITLKALTHRDTGGIIAAATTSLPEQIGGERNWDYRYCWLRDSTFTLNALIESGFTEEASAWRRWLLRAVGGDPKNMQIMYGVAGDRRLNEFELPWLPGYESSTPVRVGNAANGQLQIDVYGELMDSLHHGRRHGLAAEQAGWNLQCMLIKHLEKIWDQPDEGIWEIRGPRRHFTHSKVMAWVAFDRVVRSIEEFGLDGPLEHWRELRARIHDDVCEHGFDKKQGAFVQYYGSTDLDASLLLVPLVGFLPAGDERVTGTIDAIEKHLLTDGLVQRYDTGSSVDGLSGSEGAFLACSFWLVDCMTEQGRLDEAQAMFEKLLALRNDVGLLSEEYDPHAQRQLGNFPQAFSHIALVNSARNLHAALHPERQRGRHQRHR